MVGKRRLTKTTFAVSVEKGLATIVPAGQIIEIPVAPGAGNRTVDILWDGKMLMMFLSDVLARSHPIDS